ncbi:hypothetical protein C8Q78DRAFT_79062 [Trametes maxima]|nr:hypothetical protein C8Q78DRAFT_79062 [Trametes maxima]
MTAYGYTSSVAPRSEAPRPSEGGKWKDMLKTDVISVTVATGGLQRCTPAPPSVIAFEFAFRARPGEQRCHREAWWPRSQLGLRLHDLAEAAKPVRL